MGKQWKQGIDSIENLADFQAMNFERTLVVLFQLIPLVWGI